MGRLDVDTMLAEMSAGQWWEWIAYSHVDPFGEERGDLRAGIIAATIANANRNPKKRPRPFTPADFMPKVNQRPQKVQSWQEQLKIVEMLNAAFGGRDLRKDKGGPS